MSLAISIVDNYPIPFAELVGRVQVITLDDDRCRVVWVASGSPVGVGREAEGVATMQAIYGGTLDSIERYLSSD